MELHWRLLTFIVILQSLLAQGFILQDDRKCKYGRIEKLLRIRCYDLDLKEVPQNLKTSVEVLDLSYNRIRKLKSSSFQKYTDIKFLMLYENMILSVEPGTFEPLTALQEIDLSSNGLTTIPLELFQLPRLRNLYIDSNELTSLDLRGLEKPIRAPLEYLNIANCELKELPDFGIMPKLWQLNASRNPLDNFQVDSLANFCHLQVIDLTKTQISQCGCQQVTNHIMMLGANPKFVPVCLEALDVRECPLPYNRTIHSETFASCQTSVQLAETKNLWLFAAVCFGGVSFVLLVVLYCFVRCRRKRVQKRMQKRKPFVISPRNAINRQPEDEPLHCDIART
ncbi:leucine-rich repeat-containing protein 4C [Drosophila bipectinata]|uniref:leucine-rich repeat-containing protein 4C n=1 Tax=Drosophila bipectinata TaxID=42026 RepID=UPI001C8927B2|nr:leucine-rich repeat-containing protein 4C [Drosophila bipectinata]